MHLFDYHLFLIYNIVFFSSLSLFFIFLVFLQFKLNWIYHFAHFIFHYLFAPVFKFVFISVGDGERFFFCLHESNMKIHIQSICQPQMNGFRFNGDNHSCEVHTSHIFNVFFFSYFDSFSCWIIWRFFFVGPKFVFCWCIFLCFAQKWQANWLILMK